MREYFMELFGAGLLVGVCKLLCPEGSLKKYVGIVGAFCLILRLTFPLVSAMTHGEAYYDELISSLGGAGAEAADSVDYEEIYVNAVSEGVRIDIEGAISESLIAGCGLDAEDFEVRAELSLKDGNYTVEKTYVCLYGKAQQKDPTAVIDTVNDLTRTECVIIYGKP